MKNIFNKYAALTLVELIVVITILAILGTIAFLSFQGYSRDARDSVRISDLNSISRGMELMLSKTGRLPMPDDKVEITASGVVISFQGTAGGDVLPTVGVHNGGLDPKYNSYYTYVTNNNYNQYQILGFLENGNNLSMMNNLYANGINKFVNLEGSHIGVLTEKDDDAPVNLLGNNIDLASNINEYNLYFGYGINGLITGSGGKLLGILPNIKCSEIKEMDPNSPPGIYKMNILGDGELHNIYCNMDEVTVISDLLVQEGDFLNGEGITTEYGSTPGANSIISIDSPIDSGYAIHQTGIQSSEYEIHLPDVSICSVGKTMTLRAWVADDDNTIFHHRLYYEDGKNGYLTNNWRPPADIIDTQVVNGKTWNLKEISGIIPKEMRDFHWYIGFFTEDPKDLYFTGVKISCE